MEIYLMRHGEAVSEAVNPRRPLTDGGRREVERVAGLAKSRNVRVSRIFHSGISRAGETAEIMAAYLSPAASVLSISGLLPEADPSIARAELETARAPLMLVGHLPHLNRLAALLVGGDPERAVIEFSPAMLVCFTKEDSQWNMAWKLSPDAF